MGPTLAPGDGLLVDPLAYHRARPTVGDVVVVSDPERVRRKLVKRVAGIGPGWFTLGRRRIRARSRELGNPPDGDALEQVRLTEDQVLLISDAPELGRDSRQFGPVELGALRGQVWWRYAPPNRRGPLG